MTLFNALNDLTCRAWEAKLAREDLPQYLISLAHTDPENQFWYLAQVNEISDWRLACMLNRCKGSLTIQLRKQPGAA